MAASLSLTGPSDVVYEGQQAQLTLTLSERSRLPEAVEIRTTAASATQGYDYIHHTRRVTFFPGETSKTISISTLRDAGRELVEGIETFQVIATPVNAALGTRTATIRVADYIPVPNLFVPDVTVTEGNDGFIGVVVSVSLSSPSVLPVSVEYATADGSATLADNDYQQSAGVLTFAPGETEATFQFTILSDRAQEQDEVFYVNFFNPINVVVNPRFGVTIINDDGVPPVELPGFQITVDYLTDPVHGVVTQPVVDAVTQAVAKWQSIITGDVPFFVNPFNGEWVDDIRLDVRMGLLGPEFPTGTDGATGRNAIANAGPLFGAAPGVIGQLAIRPNPRLPYWGTIGFDPANAATDPAAELYETALHEIGHALGFGRPLLVEPRPPDYPEGLVVGTPENPLFIGPNALREFNSIFATNATSIPMENEGGGGTVLVHWEDTALPGELMNGEATPGITPLSKVTVGAMADLGYTVNYGAADPYPASGNAPQVAALEVSLAVGNMVTSPVAPELPQAVESTPVSPSVIGPTFAVMRAQAPVARKLPTRLTFPDRAPIILVDELREAVATSLSTTDGPINLRGISEGQRSMLFAWAAYGKATAPDLFSAIASESTDTRRATHGSVFVS
jgi:hypothetical protein